MRKFHNILFPSLYIICLSYRYMTILYMHIELLYIYIYFVQLNKLHIQYTNPIKLAWLLEYKAIVRNNDALASVYDNVYHTFMVRISLNNWCEKWIYVSAAHVDNNITTTRFWRDCQTLNICLNERYTHTKLPFIIVAVSPIQCATISSSAHYNLYNVVLNIHIASDSGGQWKSNQK